MDIRETSSPELASPISSKRIHHHTTNFIKELRMRVNTELRMISYLVDIPLEDMLKKADDIIR